jgi:hypothetical protein
MFKILTGPLMNLVGRGAAYGSGPTAGLAAHQTVDSLFPISNVRDGKPASPTKWAAIQTDFGFQCAANLLVNGDFEQGTTGWTAVGVTHTSETGVGNYHKGSKSAKLVSGVGGGGFIVQDVTVQAGEYLQLWAAAKSDGLNGAWVSLRCLDTFKDLNGAGQWVAAGTTCMSKIAATMGAFTPVTFRAPTLAETGKATVTLEVILQLAAAGQTAYFDEVLLVPGFNFFGVFGHNLSPGGTSRVYTGGADYWHSPSYTSALEASSLAGQVVFAYSPTMIYSPFLAWRGNPSVQLVPPGVGEVVIGQAVELGQNPDYPVAFEYQEPNVRFRSSAGTQWVLPRGGHPLRKATLSFAYLSEADYLQARDVLFGMSRGGAYPLVLIPTETDPGTAMYGRLEDSTTFRRDAFAKRMAEFIVQEEALPWF